MKNTGIILVLKDINNNRYITKSDKYILALALLQDESEIPVEIKPLALIYKANALSVKKYRINCLDKLKYSIIKRVFDTEYEMIDDLDLGRLIFDIFLYFENGKKKIKTKYNASYYSIYISQILIFDKKNAELNIVRKKRKAARAKAAAIPNAYNLLAQDHRIQQIKKRKVSDEYIQQAKLNFAKWWALVPFTKKCKSSCRRLFIADTIMNDPQNFQNLLRNFKYYHTELKLDSLQSNTLKFLLDEPHLRAYYHESYADYMENKRVLAKPWVPQQGD